MCSSQLASPVCIFRSSSFSHIYFIHLVYFQLFSHIPFMTVILPPLSHCEHVQYFAPLPIFARGASVSYYSSNWICTWFNIFKQSL